MSKAPPKITGDWLSCPQSVALMVMFEQAGYRARFVGGAVRNALLGEEVGDLDIATDAHPEEVMELAKKAGFKAVATGINHGTVTVIIDKHVYEITTLRVDVETFGRHASVSFTSDWREDAARRDFTMNAIYVDGDGTLVDPLGGYDDLLARKVRFIGDPHDRIKEDYLRILRFLRFSAQYGRGKVDSEGLEACVSLQKGLASLSAERIWHELKRLFLMPDAVVVLDVMFAQGLLLPLLSRVPHLARFNKWMRLEKRLERKPAAVDRLGALSMLIKEDVKVVNRHLRLSNEEQRVLGFWDQGLRVDENTSEKQALFLLYRFGKVYQTRIAISWVLSGADTASTAWRTLYDLPKRRKVPVFPLKGQDLIDIGMASGPSLGKKLLKLENIWIASDFEMQRDELLKQLKN
jgi:poly(A) polymerase